MDQNEAAQSQKDAQEREDTAPASSYATVMKGLVDRVYTDGDKDFGFIVHGDDEFYFDPRLLASEERAERGDPVYFTPKPPLQQGAKPAAACVLVKDKPAIGTVVNMLPNRKSCFLQVADEFENHFNVYMPISRPLGEVKIGDRFRFMADENPQGPYARIPKRVE